MGGHIMYALRSGLGVFNPPSRPNFRDPGYPPDPGIVAANNVLSNAYDLAMAQAQADNNNDQCMLNAANANSPEQYAATVARCQGQLSQQGGPSPTYVAPAYNPPVAQGPVYNPADAAAADRAAQIARAALPNARGGSLSFTTSRGTNALLVGDSWVVSITGGSPNSPVTVSGWMPSGTFGPTPMGKTDGAGNFSKSGTAGAGDIGKWQEIWAVGGVNSGAIAFTIAAVPAFIPPVKTPDTPAKKTSDTPVIQPDGSIVVLPPASLNFNLASVPLWVWGLVAGGAFLAFSGGGRGR